MVYHQGPCRTVLPTEAEVRDVIAHALDTTVNPSNILPNMARAALALFAGQPTEHAVRADEALLIVGQRDRGRGFDQLLREQLQDPEVRSGYVAGRLRQVKAEALREAADALHSPRALKTWLADRADRIESEG